MQDARRTERVKSFLRAQIIYNNRMSTIDCVVKNFSGHGARLAVDETMTVPDEFDLVIPQKGRTYRAHMAWRDKTSIGIEFVNAQTHQPHPQDSAPMDDEVASRLRALEAQNAELKARVRELSKRLEDLGQDPNLAA